MCVYACTCVSVCAQEQLVPPLSHWWLTNHLFPRHRQLFVVPKGQTSSKGGGGDWGTEGGKQSAEGDASDRGLAWGWRGTDRGVFLADRMQAFSRGGGERDGGISKGGREGVDCVYIIIWKLSKATFTSVLIFYPNCSSLEEWIGCEK